MESRVARVDGRESRNSEQIVGQGSGGSSEPQVLNTFEAELAEEHGGTLAGVVDDKLGASGEGQGDPDVRRLKFAETAL